MRNQSRKVISNHIPADLALCVNLYEFMATAISAQYLGLFSEKSSKFASTFNYVQKSCDIVATNHTVMAASMHTKFKTASWVQQKLHLKSTANIT